MSSPTYFCPTCHFTSLRQSFTRSWLGSTSPSRRVINPSNSLPVRMPSTRIGSTSARFAKPGSFAHDAIFRQTVFYTPSTLTVNADDRITGELSCAPNKRNPRDLDIIIKYQTPYDDQLTEIQYKMCVLPSLATPCRGFHRCGRTLTGCQVLTNLHDSHYLATLTRLCMFALYTTSPHWLVLWRRVPPAHENFPAHDAEKRFCANTVSPAGTRRCCCPNAVCGYLCCRLLACRILLF